MQDLPDLPAHSADGRARATALAGQSSGEITPTSIVTYLSRGRVLLVGEERAAMAAGRRLGESLRCTLMVEGGPEPETRRAEGMAVIQGGRPLLAGNLGNFELRFESADTADQPSLPDDEPPEIFDLVLDLSVPRLIDHPIPPPGYYPVGDDAAALERALETLPEMTGEFEKPKFFEYDPNICAHGNSGIQGCRRCIDACPTVAIVSIGDKVEVNPYLCQGGGSCVVACPSGAMTYAYPTVSDLLKYVRGLLTDYREAGGESPGLLFYDAHCRGAVVGGLFEQLPEHVIPVQVEEVGSVGMDAWMACLAYGADSVVLCVTDHTPSQVVGEFDAQLGVAAAILVGMGFEGRHVRLLNVSDAEAVLDDLPRGVFKDAARFAAPNEKRMILRLGIDHLYGQAPSSRKTVSLPEPAPFGEIKVDKKACTLCMGCVSVCPTAALGAGGDLPQLKFVEWNCVQCGLCRRTCPESVISLTPRYVVTEAAIAPSILNEDEPATCGKCGRPFGTQSTINRISEKLAGQHWMFQSDEQAQLIRMCDDCRVEAQMTMADNPVAAGERPRVRTTDDYLNAEKDMSADDFLIDDKD